MTQPTTPPTKPGGTPAASTSRPRGGLPRERRPLATVMFAVIAVGLVVAGGTLLQLQREDRHTDLAQDKQMEPADYALQATSNVSDLAELSPVSVDAFASLGVTDDAAVAALEQAIADAFKQLEGALASAALPPLPDATGELDVQLSAVQAVPVPQLPTPELGLDGLHVHKVVVSASPVGPRAGTPLDDALAQVASLQAQLDDLLSDSPVADLLQDLPQGVGPAGLPGGASPAQANEAGDTVDPDENGAAAASAHAQAALGVASGAFEGTLAELEALLALYDELVEKVEEALDLIRDAQEQGEEDLEALLEERLAALENRVDGLEDEADRMLDAHEQAVADARVALEASVQQASTAQVAAVRSAGEATLRDIESQADALQAEADERRRAIAAVVATASIEMGKGPEALQALQAIESAAAVADLQVERDLTSRLAALDKQARDAKMLMDQSQAQVESLASQALAEADVILAEAVADDADVHAHFVAMAREYGVQMAARESEAVNEALQMLDVEATQLTQDVLDEGLDRAEAPLQSLRRVGQIVDDAESSLLGEVGKDVDYVTKVGKDYGRVPTDERKERAAHWSGLALDLEGDLQQVVLEGRTLESLARDVLAAAEEAQAELEDLA